MLHIHIVFDIVRFITHIHAHAYDQLILMNDLESAISLYMTLRLMSIIEISLSYSVNLRKNPSDFFFLSARI